MKMINSVILNNMPNTT